MQRLRRGLVASVLAVGLLSLAGCSDTGSLGYDFHFSRGPQGWMELFADYPANDEAIFGLVADYRPLREPLDTSQSALYIAGTNRSDDLWMQYKTEVALPADTTFKVSFDVEIATNVPSGCGGVGGAPGEGVTVKAGVSLIEPDRELDAAGWWRMNVDKGNQTAPGEDAVVIGDLANSRPCEEGFVWERKRLGGPPMTFTTDSTGRAWLFVGTDSGYEPRSAVYYTRFRALFEPMSRRRPRERC
ncbi:MAG: PEP-CTERM sorting domain-containing protein [Acidobacteriota bacterium]